MLRAPYAACMRKLPIAYKHSRAVEGSIQQRRWCTDLNDSSATLGHTLLAQGFDVLRSLEGALLCCCLLAQVVQYLSLHCLCNHVPFHKEFIAFACIAEICGSCTRHASSVCQQHPSMSHGAQACINNSIVNIHDDKVVLLVRNLVAGRRTSWSKLVPLLACFLMNVATLLTTPSCQMLLLMGSHCEVQAHVCFSPLILTMLPAACMKKKKNNITSSGQPTRLITSANHGNDVLCS